MTQEAPTRRVVVPGLIVTAAGAAAGYVVASGSSAADPKPPAAEANAAGTAAGGGDTATPLANLADIPANGGLVLEDASMVLTRDGGNGVKAFTSVCTHQGCNVSSVEGGKIICPCHGSKFDAQTGAPVAGPAGEPLAPIPVTVRDDAVFRG
ncbi:MULTISPECIES: Rieske (2Fe-2S) protein [unclassified Parafrankia]|uniref:Rieske (2Fe-2S) protein n=1 Tax=Parafrankia TaxID=2994362 RepID=UPI000DA4D922|nr:MULTISPECIES: Rieske (2Fe-2S) protein [unclassified Parafrankia]TCJ32887.1 Rieske (2Fe-2S) protein [Parafrankia sp. BMG5.11]CAI7980006.1 Cytochrome bc1 complex Rieske iron-sulfur subunit [Frankia sp. Hr75.2]SQD98522.1 Cytochrome b6-f complex iron-sulfur subunit, Rieske (2Fe-2S) domain protein [Parafrankia sp. Ea1.12]